MGRKTKPLSKRLAMYEAWLAEWREAVAKYPDEELSRDIRDLEAHVNAIRGVSEGRDYHTGYAGRTLEMPRACATTTPSD